MSYIIMADVVIPVLEPDGGISADHETEEYDGDMYETREEAEKELARAKELNPNTMLWISERD